MFVKGGIVVKVWVIFELILCIFILFVVFVIVEYLKDFMMFNYLRYILVYEWMDDFGGKVIMVLWCKFIIDVV